jgi:predicted CXXCH cytochrome family protein
MKGKKKLVVISVLVLLIAFLAPFGYKLILNLLNLDLNPYVDAKTSSGIPVDSSVDITKDSNECLKCHTEKKSLMLSNNKHNLFLKGNCTACHPSHKGEKMPQKLVTTSTEQLCRLCHVQTSGKSYTVNHQPFQKGECTKCHNPHGSDQRI